MQTIRLFFRKAYWTHVFSFYDFLRGIVEGFGGLYLITKVAEFLFKPQVAAVMADFPRALPGALLGCVIANAIYHVRPKRAVSCSLAGRDVKVAIEVGDLFETGGALVIGSNRTFDTQIADHLIDATSIQGQFTAKYYESQNQHLDADLSASLATIPFEELPNKVHGKRAFYPIGTVAMVRPQKKGVPRRAYFLAIAELNQDGRAHGSIEDLRSAMGELWAYISERGGNEPLRIPVLGTGFSRLTEQRAEIVRELINSFIAACSDRQFCESLTIVISPADYGKYDIDLEELGRYLAHVCKYTKLGRSDERGTGAPVAVIEQSAAQ
jgi:hypothetical protein